MNSSMSNMINFTLNVKRKDGKPIDEFGLGGILYQLENDPMDIFVPDLIALSPELYSKYYQVPSYQREKIILFMCDVSAICKDYLFQLDCTIENSVFYRINFSDGDHECVYGKVVFDNPIKIGF